MTTVKTPLAPGARAAGPERSQRGLALVLIAAVLALTGLIGAGAPAGAAQDIRCACESGTTASQARTANVIFVGEVTSVERVPVTSGPEVFNDTYVATVEAIYKGNLDTTETTFRTDRVFGQCVDAFAVGERVLVFGETSEPLKVRGCGGTAQATTALMTEIEAIFGAGTSPVPPTPFEVTYTAPADQPGAPASISRSAAPGLALVLVALASLFVVRRLGRPRN